MELKRFFSLLLICAMLLSLSVTAFAEGEDLGYTQDPADLQAMVDCVASNNIDITLSEQYFAVEYVPAKHQKFELTTDGGEITGFLCAFIDESVQADLLTATAPVPSANEPTITFSKDVPYEMVSYPEVVPNPLDNSWYLDYSTRIGFCVVGDVEQETTITLNVYTVFSTAYNPVPWVLQKTVQFTVQPTVTESTGNPIPPVIGGLLPTLGSQVMSPFVDVTPVDYYYDAVNWAVDNGITTGTGRLSFSPDEACTRAQAVTFLWRAAGSPAPKNAVTPFVDVDSGAYYAKAVAWAVENGITIGTSATTFSPDEPCTRAHIVTFLYRAFGKEAGTAVPFADVAADAYYAPAVAWAAANNITGGTGSGRFSPDSDCTRAQIVTFLYRARAN